MRITSLTITVIFGCLFNTSAQNSNTLIHFPSLSSDGNSIAFSYQGDIWTSNVDGSNARRITIHEGYDTRPLWSQDNGTIAFQSDRFGNDDIFVVPSGGGIPKQLTFHSSNDELTDFTADGDVVFTSKRNFAQAEWEPEILKVNQRGGTPERILSALGYDAKISPNKNLIVFTKGACRIVREAYEGPANRDIWVYNIKKDSYVQLTDNPRNDFYPHWGDDNTIYFQSSRSGSGKYNIHKLSIDENGEKKGTQEAITSFTDLGIFSFYAKGNKAVTIKGDNTYLFNLSNKTSEKVNISINSDYRFDPNVKKKFSSKVDEIAPSPNGKYSALVIRGEIFITENDKEKKKTINLSNSAYRDQDVNWLNDSTIIFSSDRDGQKDIYVIKSADSKEGNLFKSLKRKITKITATPEDESSLVISPDMKKLVFIRGNSQLIVANISSDLTLSKQKTLSNKWDVPGGVVWSPDSKWLAYGLSDLNFNQEVYIQKADNSQKAVNVSMHPKYDGMPVWSADGSKLGFTSNRNNSDLDIWFVWLKKEDWEKTKQEWKEDNDSEKDEKRSEDKKTDKKKGKIVDIQIDFEEIYQRQVQVTSFPGSEVSPLISKDGKTFYYTTAKDWRRDFKIKSDLFKIKWDGTENKPITIGDTQPANTLMNSKLNFIYLTTKGGKLSRIKLSTDKKESLPILAKMRIDYLNESNQIFEEAWKAINDGFYDPQFHGQDWSALKKLYKPLAMKASTRDDFKEMVNWMLGQINASHMGLYGGEDRKSLQKNKTGRLGIEVKPVADGVQIIGITVNMPATRNISTLKVGETITHVDGISVSPDTNFHSLLNDTSNERVLLGVKNSSGSNREVEIRPKATSNYERYLTWVKGRKKLTEQYSKGRLGYLHIEGMGWKSFEEFERELTAAGLDKEGIVIDVRHNGGGWTTDYLMAVLAVKQHAYTVPRGAAKNLKEEHKKFSNYYPYSERLPFASWTKPSIAMCNETSYSNAEIFSHAYKSLGLGTLVGQPTFGAVISTGGQTLIDGSLIRMPFRGWYVKDSETNMELGPAMPDIIVENAPDEKSKGIDSQLKKAVEELLKQIDQ